MRALLKNKILVFFLAVAFLFNASIQPARAFLPAVLWASSIFTEGTAATNAVAALTVGTAIGMMWLKNQNQAANTDPNDNFAGIPVGTLTASQLPTPAGWSSPTSPPSSVPLIAGYIATLWNGSTNVPGPFSSTPQAACDGIVPLLRQYYSGYPNAAVTSVSAGVCVITLIPGDNTTVRTDLSYYNDASSCPAGYTSNGTVCALSSASAVVKPADGRCGVLASVSGFTIDPQDPECSGLGATGTTVSSTQAKATKANGDSDTVTINPDGTRTITRVTTNTVNNTTTTTNIYAAPDPANPAVYNLTGISMATVPGTGTAAGTGSAPVDIKFPDDYNREATQLQMRQSLTDIHGDLDSSAFVVPPVDPNAAKTLADAENKKITDELAKTNEAYDNFKLLDWSTWIPVFPAASCSPFTGSVMGRTISIDLCSKIAVLNQTIGWLLSVWAAWSVVSLMFRKEG